MSELPDSLKEEDGFSQFDLTNTTNLSVRKGENLITAVIYKILINNDKT